MSFGQVVMPVCDVSYRCRDTLPLMQIVLNAGSAREASPSKHCPYVFKLS